MTTFFTSDTHFGHSNIIKYSNRPFANVDEMDAALIDNWNQVVKPGDLVFHLGDFSFKNPEIYLKQLNGKITLIKGNHDSRSLSYVKNAKTNGPCLFTTVKDVMLVRVEGQELWLSHYAHRVWPKSHHGCWHLYGHSHGSLPDNPESKSFDVGVDCHSFKPLSFSEVKAIMDKKIQTSVDHHK